MNTTIKYCFLLLCLCACNQPLEVYKDVVKVPDKIKPLNTKTNADSEYQAILNYRYIKKDSARKSLMKDNFSKGILKLDTEAISFKIIRNPNDDNWIYVEYIYQNRDPYAWKILKVNNHNILKVINTDKFNLGFLDTAFFLKINGYNHSVIAVETNTHHGNGEIDVFGIQNDDLKILMSSRTQTNSETFGNIVIAYKNNKLRLKKNDINKDGYDDIEIGGTIIATICINKNLSRDSLYSERKVYLWNSSKQKFIPDFKLWKGIISKREGDDIFGP